MKYKINEAGQEEVSFAAKLLSIGEVKETKNDNKTPYRLATIQFVDESGVEQTIIAIVWEKSFQQGMEIGSKYSTVVVKDNDSYFTTMFHSLAAETANSSMFKFGKVNMSEVSEEAFEAYQTN